MPLPSRWLLKTTLASAIPRPAERNLQLLLLLLLTGILRLRLFVDGGTLRFDCACPLVMLAFGIFDRCLGFRDCLVPSLAILSEGGLFLLPLGFAAALLSLERQRGLAGCLVIDLAGRLSLCWPFCGSVLSDLASGKVRGQLCMFFERPV